MLMLLLVLRVIGRCLQASRGDSWHAVKGLWGLVWPLSYPGHVELLQGSNWARFLLAHVHQVCHAVHHIGNLQRAHVAPHIPMFHQLDCLQSNMCAFLHTVK